MQDATNAKDLEAPTGDHDLKQILDNFPDGVFTITTELAIQYVNPAFCRIVGYTEEELLGTQITEYLGDLRILDACMAEVAECGHCNDQETIFKRKDGSMVHISKNVQAVMDQDGNFKEILVSIRDMSELHGLNKELEAYAGKLETTLEELKGTQEQLVESEKLASLGGLVAGIAHEINTPLGISITSASSMHEELESLKKGFMQGSMKRSQLDQFLEQADDACSILYQNLMRASDLVNSFKQVAVDQTVDEVRRINLGDYCQEVLTSLGPKLKNSPVGVTSHCESGIEIETHPGAIYQLVSNLIMNSLIHGYEEGQSGNIQIKSSRSGNDIHIEYSDDGKGIDPENLARIFEPFFTTRRGHGGSGLGLSIVYNIVTGTLKGSVRAESKPGEGVTFHIHFPAA